MDREIDLVLGTMYFGTRTDEATSYALLDRFVAGFGSALAPAVASRLLARMRAPRVSLSSREIEVLRLVADGRSNREIGELLFISEKTAGRHLSNIFVKLDVPSRAAATAGRSAAPCRCAPAPSCRCATTARP